MGFEPTTSDVTGRRSNRAELRPRPNHLLLHFPARVATTHVATGAPARARSFTAFRMTQRTERPPTRHSELLRRRISTDAPASVVSNARYATRRISSRIS